MHQRSERAKPKRQCLLALLPALTAISLAFSGCSTTHFKESADREAYKLIKQKTPDVPNMDANFTIEKTAVGLDDLPLSDTSDEALGDYADTDKGAKIITLERALDIAVKNNRNYQNQKELVYLTALDLSLSRYEFQPIWHADGSVDYARSTEDRLKLSPEAELAQAAPGIIQSVGELVGAPGALINDYANIVEQAATKTGINQPDLEIANQRSVEGQTSIGVDLLLKGGARIALDLTSNFLRFLTGDPRVSTSSALIGSIRQPLLRGAGSRVAAEQLMQSERDLLYSLRDFAQFRKEFAVDIASDYYRVLQARDEVRNNYRGYQALLRGSERQRALADAGRATKTDVGRSEQASLSAQDSWVASIANYRQQLDQFKILLGLSTDTELILDDRELELLRANGITHPNISSEDAVKVGLVSRLDLYVSQDRVLDADRKVHVAANALKPGLDLIVDARVASMPGDDRFQELDFQRALWSAGFDIEAPLDRKQQRNSYRSSLISYERAKRAGDLATDNVKLEIRQAWRDLDQAKRSFEIRKISETLNESRVEEQELRSQAGTATALDQIDAQNDLIAAENALTDALVSHTVSRLQFWRSMGILFIKENGQWEDVKDVENANG
jgi:outer membrane protein TolC